MTADSGFLEWLLALKAGDAVVAHSQYAKPQLARVVFVDTTKIYYGDAQYPDWVWRGTGVALTGTRFWRRVERPE